MTVKFEGLTMNQLAERNAELVTEMEQARIAIGSLGWMTLGEAITLTMSEKDKQIAELQRKVEALAAEISRRDAIFVPLYPSPDLMYLLTDVFHDTVEIDYENGGVDNQELVITALINNFFKHIETLSPESELFTITGSYLAEMHDRFINDAVSAIADSGALTVGDAIAAVASTRKEAGL